MMTMRYIAAPVALTLFAVACAHGRATTTNTLGATANADTAAPCVAAPDAEAIPGWRLITAEKFAFCLPPKWRVTGQSATLGSATLQWGAGEPPRSRAVMVRSRVVSSSSSRPAASSAPPPDLDVENQKMSELIGGKRADVWRNRIATRYSTGATFGTPHVWIVGAAESSSDVDAELAIVRTVRFPATP